MGNLNNLETDFNTMILSLNYLYDNCKAKCTKLSPVTRYDRV